MTDFNSFFFRTFSSDGESGILYLAIGIYGDNAYNCAGARQIGVHNGKQLWYIADRDHGGYTDAMPAIAMFDPQPSNMNECNEQLENDPPNDFTTLFSDGKSYWFVDNSLINKRVRSTSQKRRSKKVNRSKSGGK
jgi:hypothetical protein